MSSIYGLIGESLSHSLSPKIHESFFLKTGVLGKYGLFEVKRKYLHDAVLGLKALGIKGANVTIPYKTEIIRFLDDISDEAEKIGAVNTLIVKEDKITGANTDYYGFGMTLDRYHIEPKGKTAVVLGTGGASRAIVQYLLDNDIGDITLVSTHVQKAKEQFPGLSIISYEDLHCINERDILINCTPVGMFPNMKDSPVCAAHVAKFKAVIDLIYNPKQTILLKSAQELNMPAINGLYMLVAQAAKAQELWNEIALDKKIIEQVYLQIDGKIG